MAYVSVFLLALFEAVAVIGVVVPGTTGVAAAGGAAHAGQLSYWGVLGTAVLGAFLGDTLSYVLGLWLHRWKRLQPWLERHEESVERAEHFVRRWGVLAVVIGRFLAPTRAFVPLIAGSTRMPIGRFMLANVAGALAWAFMAVTLGEEALAAYEHIPRKWSVIALGVAALLAFAWMIVHRALAKRRRRARRAVRKRKEAPPWHALDVAAIVSAQETDLARGLTNEEARARLARKGPNVVHLHEAEPWWEELMDSLSEPLQLLLVAVGVVYFMLGEVADGITILAIILAVAAVEVISERRGKRAVAALSAMAAPIAFVVREGTVIEAHPRELVPGDLVLLRPGERVPADVRVVESVALRIDESVLTGEALPVLKASDAQLAEDAPLADRRTMAFASTLVRAGRGRGFVVATGRRTEFGHLAHGMEEAKEPATPLSRAMCELSRWLLAVAIALSAIIPLLGVFVAGRPAREMLLTGLTLAFATIPEELPILIVIVLGIGALRLARRGAIAKCLRAAETLGNVTVVATDKTGTLTRNELRIASIVTSEGEQASHPIARRLLEIAVLANDAELAGGEVVGDPIDTAIIDAARDAGLDIEAIRSARILEERPFDDVRKRMSVVVEEGGAQTLAVKGAPEAVLALSSAIRVSDGVVPLDDATRAVLRSRVDALATEGLRTVAVAERAIVDDAEESSLVWLGLIALSDPVREEAPATVRSLERAGVRVVMVTGDHPETARAIAERAGLARGGLIDGSELTDAVRDASVIARITPEQKLRVVRALQDDGAIVAVTGDGVNDAPALRAANVGVTMGKTGTDVAREAADIVLANDDLAAMSDAVRTGRVLFANVRKAVRYYLSAKLALVLAALAAVLLGLPIPFAPVQIIVLELSLDLGASLTFVSEPAEDDVMARGPRDPRARLVDRAMVLGIVLGALSLTAAVLVPYLIASARGDIALAQTTAFVAWMIAHVVLAAHMRSEREPLLHRNPLANRPFVIWAGSAALLVALALSIPFLRARLHIAPLTLSLFAVIAACAILIPSFWEPIKWVLRSSISRARRLHAHPAGA